MWHLSRGFLDFCTFRTFRNHFTQAIGAARAANHLLIQHLYVPTVVPLERIGVDNVVLE